jgi:hypothetical protein
MPNRRQREDGAPYNGPERRKLIWDPSDTGTMEEPKWRSMVVDQINRIHSELAENTNATKAGVAAVEEMNRKVDDLNMKVAPVVAVSDKVTKGMEVIGWIGGGAEWIVKKWFYVVIIVVAGKILLSGGTWQEVLKLWREVE